MQTVFINSQPIEATPVRSHKKAFWTIGILFAILLISLSILLTQRYFGPPATLQLTTARGTGSVQVDSASAFPVLFKADLNPGSHQLTVTDTDHAAAIWKNTITLTRGTLTSVDLDLGPSTDFTGAVTLSLTRGSDLIIHTTPDKAHVLLDGDDIGLSPITRHIPGPGTHTIIVKKDSYLDKTFQVNITNGFTMTADVALFKNPSFPVTTVKSADIKPNTSPNLTIISRTDSGLAKIAGDLAKPTTQAWTSATLVSLNAPDASLPSDSLVWLKGLYYHSLIHLKLPDLPFQYLIDRDGKIYEGRSGGRDSVTFDPTDNLETAAKSPTLRPGVVYVGYLGTKDSVSKDASESFDKLVAFLGRNGSPAAQAIQKIKVLDTSTGFLRVRKSPSTAASEVSRVKPGDTFDLITEQSGWTEIKLSDGSTGWVDSRYVQKI